MAHKWVKKCCDKVESHYQTEYGAWVETGKVGNQTVKSERHAEHQATMIAMREAVANGEVDRLLDMKFGG